MNAEPDPFEKRLRAMDSSRPSDGFVAAALDHFAGRAPAPRAGLRRGWPLALAACALAAVGMWARQKLRTATSPSVPEPVSSSGQFSVLVTRPARQRALVQEYDDFKIESKGVGDALGSHQLKMVTADSLTLASAAGQIETRAIAEINAEAERELEREIDALRARYRAGLTDGIVRLRTIALVRPEVLAGLSLPGTMAASGQPDYARRLIQKALEPQTPYREKVIASLSKLEAPEALAALRQILFDDRQTESIRLTALASLKQLNPVGALHALQPGVERDKMPAALAKAVDAARAELLEKNGLRDEEN